MNGRRLPLHWSERVRRLNGERTYTLLDAASLVSTTPLDFGDITKAPDFTVLSFYKMFGFPDLGALIVRKDAGHVFQHRKYFGGGTVELVGCSGENWHIKKDGALHEQLEDGTLPIHNIVALDCAITVHENIFGSFKQISEHTSALAKLTYERLSSLTHSNGRPTCKIYKSPSSSYSDSQTQGAIIAFNLLDSNGRWISNYEVRKLASVKMIHLRTGTLCNPGGVITSLDLDPADMRSYYAAGFRCGNENDITGGKPMGMIRISFGALSTLGDITTFLNFIEEFFVEMKTPGSIRLSSCVPGEFFVESLCIFPIKSCGGMRIPPHADWPIKPEGLAWDREWCLVHQGTRAALSQKSYPQMALMKPSIDLVTSDLRIRFTGSINSIVASEIAIPLAVDHSHFAPSSEHDDISSNCFTRLCGVKIKPLVYSSRSITAFFTAHLGVPCELARFPSASSSSLAPRLAKTVHRHQPPGPPSLASPTFIMPGGFPSPPPSPPPRRLLLSNESPILIISRSSVKAVNNSIRANLGTEASSDVFRANIVLAQKGTDAEEVPWVEDTWTGIRLRHSSERSNNDPLSHPQKSEKNNTELHGNDTCLEIMGQCRRCQMVCVDQESGNRGQEPFVQLSKMRRWKGGVWFGVHAGLADEEGEGRSRVGDLVETW